MHPRHDQTAVRSLLHARGLPFYALDRREQLQRVGQDYRDAVQADRERSDRVTPGYVHRDERLHRIHRHFIQYSNKKTPSKGGDDVVLRVWVRALESTICGLAMRAVTLKYDAIWWNMMLPDHICWGNTACAMLLCRLSLTALLVLLSFFFFFFPVRDALTHITKRYCCTVLSIRLVINTGHCVLLEVSSIEAPRVAEYVARFTSVSKTTFIAYFR